jgi:hypothetical protein
MQSPILIICCNRFNEFFKLFKVVSKQKNRKIYIFQDGKKKDNDKNYIKLNNFLKKIKKRNLFVKFSKDNLGCKYGVVTAINWFFSKNQDGIILEDDCIPSDSFFQYCDELLIKYKNNKKIKIISGYRFGNKINLDASYFFSKQVELWGWATWKKVWKDFDLDMNDWPKNGDMILKKRFNDNKGLIKIYQNKFENTFLNKIDTWDYQFVYYIWKTNGLCILPKNNLIKNIGFNKNATHTKKKNLFLEKKIVKVKFPIKHPPLIKQNLQIDAYLDTEFKRNLTGKRLFNFFN